MQQTGTDQQPHTKIIQSTYILRTKERTTHENFEKSQKDYAMKKHTPEVEIRGSMFECFTEGVLSGGQENDTRLIQQ